MGARRGPPYAHDSPVADPGRLDDRQDGAGTAQAAFAATRAFLAATEAASQNLSRVGDIVWSIIVLALTVFVVWKVVTYVMTGVTWGEVGHVFVLGLITLLRVAVLIAIASLIWVPVGVLIGLRPALSAKIQPLAQFLAAFPANLLFPVFVVVIVKFDLNPDIWLSPLIVLARSGISFLT